MPRSALVSYIVMGACGAILVSVRLIDWANYWMQQPSDRLKGG